MARGTRARQGANSDGAGQETAAAKKQREQAEKDERMTLIRQAHVDALNAAEAGDDDAETAALELAAKLEAAAGVEVNPDDAAKWKADADAAKAEAQAKAEAEAPDQDPDEKPDEDLTPTERKLAILRAARLAREIESDLRCFACQKKAGKIHLRLAFGMALCADCGLEALLDAAERADQLKQKSVRSALNLHVRDLTEEEKQEEAETPAAS